jgi:uncharacterized delta-60 repeat protein
MKIKSYLFLILIVLSGQLFAQPGANDPTFNPGDVGYGYGDGPNSDVSSSSIQPDGKIIIAGSFTSYNGQTINRIARINTDGSLDGSFNPGIGANSSILSTSLQQDGKVIAAGYFISYNGSSVNRIARINVDGSLDATFNPGSGANDAIWTTFVQSDGKIIIGGDFTSYNGVAVNKIARLNVDGSLDLSFNTGTGFVVRINSISTQSDGKILVGGWFSSFNSVTVNNLVRLNTDGSLDGSFNTGGFGTDSQVKAISILPDGRIMIVGEFTSFNYVTINRVARLNSNGSLDATFNPGLAANWYVSAIAIQSDGKIILGGQFTSYNGAPINGVARINPNGSLDLSFNSSLNDNSWVMHIAVLGNGKIIIGGMLSAYNGLSKRFYLLNTDGSLDEGFIPGSGSDGTIKTTCIQPDGKVIIGGEFTRYNGTTQNSLARLNIDGSLDIGFDIGNGFNGEVRSTVLQSDGKLIVGGDFTTFNGITRNGITRLNSDGTLDLTFNPGTGISGVSMYAEVYTISIQNDGKIIIGGFFTAYNGIASNYIARLNTDGSLDASFDPGTGSNSTILTTSIQSDGKIIIAGDISVFNGIVCRAIARLNLNGSLDPTFNSGNGTNSQIYTTSLQNDGKIIIGGFFTAYNGIASNYIARLNTDGSLDATFNPVSGPDSGVFTVGIQSDGKIIIGGAFTNCSGEGRNRVARLNTDGSLDASFNPGLGANNSVRTTSIQADGRIIIGGEYSDYDITGRNRIARILNTYPPTISSFNPTSACSGTGTVVITGTNFTDASAVSIGGISVSSFTVLSATEISATIGNNSTGVIAVTTPGGTAVSTADFAVNTLPMSAGQIIGSSSVCQGQNAVTYEVPSITNATSYVWTLPNGVSGSSTTNSITLDYGLSASSGNITVKGNNACGFGAESLFAITVNQLPNVSAGLDQTVCAGTSVTLSASGAVNYSWDNAAQDGVSFIPSGTQVYTVTGTDANNCSNTDQVSVMVNTLPTINAGSDQTVCEGTPITLSGSGAVNYSWDNGGINNYPFFPASSILYTVTGTDANNCSNTDQVSVTVNTLPTINAGSDQTICTGTSVTLTGSGAINYSWDNAAQDGVSFIPSGTQVYTVTGTDANNCSNTDQVSVMVNTLPTINAGSDQTVCAGTSVTLTGSGAVNYSWDNAAQDGVSFIPTGTQVYTVTGTDANNCSNSDQVTVTVNTLPTINAGADQTVCDGEPVTLTASGGTSYAWNNSIQDGVSFTPSVGSTTYTVTGTDANNCSNTDDVIVTVNAHTTATETQSALDSYTWSVNGQTYSSSGTYTATILNAAGCDSTITLNLTLNFTGISETEVSSVRVYPNPAEDILYVRSTLELNSELRVLDMNGRLLFEQHVMGTEVQLPLESLASGSYLLLIGDGKPLRFQKN